MAPVSTRQEESERIESRGASQAALIPHFIGGERLAGRGGRTGAVFNPSTGQASGRVALASRHDVDDAVSSGAKAFAEWSSWSPLKRARVMFRFRELLESHPLRQGLAELVAYLQLAAERPATSIDDEVEDRVTWTTLEGRRRQARLPRVIFTR